MNNNKICFISCVNDEILYAECIKYIENLYIPDEFQIETIAIKEAKSMTSGYNEAMKNSDAKYKIYLHQDTFIINKNFILDMLSIFERHEKIGLMGVAGAKTIPTNGVWWDSIHKYGKVYESHTGKMELLAFNEVKKRYEDVKAIDGLIMMTQYDIPWREDIFDGWHFYDVSQSIEFRLAGYEVVIPNQYEPWCIHDCELLQNLEDYNLYKKKFIDSYNRDVFPKVSIAVICKENINKLKDSIESAICQSYVNKEVVVVYDEVYKDKIYSIVQLYEDKCKFISSELSFNKIIECTDGEYINLMHEGDILDLEKLNIVMDCFINEELVFVTSSRKLIDDNKNIATGIPATDSMIKENITIEGVDIINIVLSNNVNIIGELSTVVFQRKYLDNCTEKVDLFKAIGDIYLWIQLACKGKIKYLTQNLSFIRLKNYKNEDICSNYIKDWLELLEYTYNIGMLKHKINYYRILVELRKKLKIFKSDDVSDNVLDKQIDNLRNELKFKPQGYYSEAEKSKVWENYYFDDENNIFIENNFENFGYADGSERYIEEVFKREEKIGSYPVNLVKYIKDWGSKYHLTHERTNLLDSVAGLMDREWDVLELGAGMGSNTPWLAERFKSVDCIEGSNARASALKKRTKNYDNVNVFVNDISNMEFPKRQYGLITLLGVLEYVPYYSTEKLSPREIFIKFLSRLTEYLSEDGVLIVAIENKLGAKYFSGCTEDHNGGLFSGILGYPNKSPITFSRYEMKKILNDSGFKETQFYHLFPDYKLPKVIIKEADEVHGMDIGGMYRGLFEDYSGNRQHLMLDPLLVKTFNDANLLFDFSNSFLILCSKDNITNLKTDYLLRKYWNSTYTDPVFHHTVDFIKSRNEIKVKRSPIYFGDRVFEDDNFKYAIKDEDMIKGQSITSDIYKSVIKNDNYESLISICRKIHNELIQNFSKNTKDKEGYLYVDGTTIDYCYNNLISINDALVFIDKKWSCKKDITDDFVMYRNLKGIYLETYPYLKGESFSDFIIKIMKNIFPQYDIDRFNGNSKDDSKFFDFVKGKVQTL